MCALWIKMGGAFLFPPARMQVVPRVGTTALLLQPQRDHGSREHTSGTLWGPVSELWLGWECWI